MHMQQAKAEKPPMTDQDRRALRDVFGAFVTGVTIITTLREDGTPWGVTANSFSSVSLDPPLVLWSQGTHGFSYPIFAAADRFIVNILGADQMALSQRFATPEIDRFAGLAWQPGIGGLARLEGCLAHLECRKVATYPGGDHAIFLGEVERFDKSGLAPLAFSSGRYSAVQPLD